MEIVPIEFSEACHFIKTHHRHHRPPQGHKFSIAVAEGDKIVGVAVVGRPVARMLDNGWRVEVTRVCSDGTANVCSMLYAACWRAAKAMGYKEIITYTLASETGTSLKAAGWVRVGAAGGGSWGSRARPRVDKHPLQPKIKYSMSAR